MIHVVHAVSVLITAILLLGVLPGCGGRQVSSSLGDHSMMSAPVRPAVEAPAAAMPAPPLQPAPLESRPSAAVPEKVEASPPPPVTALPPPPTAPSQVVQSPPLMLQDVYFDYDRFMLRDEARKTLENNAMVLKGENGWKLVVEGHCDERGTTEYNLLLGERRAQAVKRYLINLGLPASQVQIVSYGKERPFCSDQSDECRQRNRRAHFVIE